MAEHSFSLQFNPLQRIRTIKDYEKEIEELRNENFEIKHQLSHYKVSSTGNVQEDIHKLLLDSKRSIDILEAENGELSRQLEGMKEMARRAGEENGDIEARLRNDLQEYVNKVCMLEDENGRLLKHLESINEANGKLKEENSTLHECFNRNKSAIEEQRSFIERMGREKEERSLVEKELVSCKNALLNCAKEKEQMAYEQERERGEYSNGINQMQAMIGNLESRMNLKDSELMRIREYYGKMEREYETVYKQRQSDELYLREMKENYTRETKDKQDLALKNEELRKEVEELRASRTELKRRIEVCENEKRALSYKVSQDRAGVEEINRMRGELENLRKERSALMEESENRKKNCLAHVESLERLKGLEVFLRDVLQEKRKECDRRLGEVEKMAEEIMSKIDLAKRLVEHSMGGTREMPIGEDNKRFLRSLNVNLSMPFDEVVGKLKSLYGEMNRKMRMMNENVHEVREFGENKDMVHEKTMRSLDEFTKEFDIARRDLEACKRYLEKKGRENKELKASNMVLEKKFKECKRNEEKIRDLYSTMASRLRKKDEAISKLEMRVGARL